MGASSGSVSAIVHRLREHGDELPYRNPARRAVHRGARDRRRLRLRQTPDSTSHQAIEPGRWDELSDADVTGRIGANVATLRQERGLTKEQLGEAIESDRTYVHRIEAGANVPRLALIVKLAAGLNVRCSRITASVLWRPECGRFYLDGGRAERKTGMARLGKTSGRLDSGLTSPSRHLEPGPRSAAAT